jgi:lipoyl(octanoyl) transferase
MGDLLADTMTKTTTSDAEPLTDTVLQAYLLGTVDFEAVLRLQRRLLYEVSGDPTQAAVILCEHPPLITVGRQGSRAHILCEAEELRVRQWRVRWVNRGGGCWLHLPGQLALYPILPLDRFGMGLESYLRRLQGVVASFLADFDTPASSLDRRPGVWVDGRLLAGVGVAVRDWVSYFGLCVNVHPPLECYRLIRCGGRDDHAPMTSLERERRGPVRPALARQRLLEHFSNGFGFCRRALFTSHTEFRSHPQKCQATR